MLQFIYLFAFTALDFYYFVESSVKIVNFSNIREIWISDCLYYYWSFYPDDIGLICDLDQKKDQDVSKSKIQT